MDSFSIGAVGAAFITAIISLLGLIVTKEQKVSEFRQAWINDLRKCLVDYLVNINTICDAISLRRAGKSVDDTVLMNAYKLLNEASHGIELRINGDEKASKELLEAMRSFQELASDNVNFTPEKIKNAETGYLRASKNLLKLEWVRVKNGEKVFVYTKRFSMCLIVALLVSIGYSASTSRNSEKAKASLPKEKLSGKPAGEKSSAIESTSPRHNARQP